MNEVTTTSTRDAAAQDVPPPFTPDQFAQAAAEGWAVVECGLGEFGRPRVQLHGLEGADGQPALFSQDSMAWQHVVDRARAHSPLHRQALRLVDDIELMLIESSCGFWGGEP